MTAYTPNLPALITALPSDHTRAPQTEFDRARQVLFLENLSVTGSVRPAACAAQVSHHSVDHMRRALLPRAVDRVWMAQQGSVLPRFRGNLSVTFRAIDGIEAKVSYHGEEAGARTRYSDRLLLAHVARLDRLVENPAANAFAEGGGLTYA